MPSSVVVLGAGQGGLSAAIHARLAGADVLVLEQRDEVGGKACGINTAGYRLDPGPSIIILTRLYEAVFRRAGKEMGHFLRFQRLDPFTRVYFEGEEPIDLPAEREACLDLLQRLFPQDAESFRDLMAKMDRIAPHIDASVFRKPYHQLWQLADPRLVATALPFDFRKTYRQLVDAWFTSPLLRAFFYGFPSYGGQSYDAKSIGGLMIPYLMLQEGVWYPEGGVAAIPAAFRRLAEELGVQFRTGAKVIGLELEGSKVKAAKLETGERVEADRFISNIDRFHVSEWLGRRVDLEPSFSYFTMHWGLQKPLPGLEHHTLLVPKAFEAGFNDLYADRRFPREPIVYLNDTSKLDPSTAPVGRQNLFAVVTCPAKEKHLDWNQERESAAARTRSVMRKFGLDFEPDAADFERVQTPLTFEERDSGYRGSLYGVDERHRLWGLFPPRVIDEEIGNLFYCGGSVQPGAGLPMVTLSGQFAASAVTGQTFD